MWVLEWCYLYITLSQHGVHHRSFFIYTFDILHGTGRTQHRPSDLHWTPISQSIRELTHKLTSTHHLDRVWCCEDIVDAVCSVLDAVCVCLRVSSHRTWDSVLIVVVVCVKYTCIRDTSTGESSVIDRSAFCEYIFLFWAFTFRFSRYDSKKRFILFDSELQC